MEVDLRYLRYVALTLLSLYFISRRSRRHLNLPPGPRGWPIIGHLHLLGSLPHRSIHRLCKMYGPIMYLKLASVPCVVGSSAEMDLSEDARPHLRVAPRNAAGKYTVFNYSDIVLNAVFNIGDYIPWLSWLDLQGYVRRMKALSKRFEVFLEEILEEQDMRRKRVPDYVPKDMVDVLLQQSDDPQIKLPRHKVKAFTQDMMAGGTESSATLVEWGMTELLRKPEVFKKANEEIDRVVERERWVVEKDIVEMEYLQSIVKETMRLHLVAPMLVPHLATQDSKVGGYDIPANTRVFVSVWTIGRDEKLWESPEEFLPERFVGSTLDVKGRDYELLPFGSGRRMCPGYSLGLKVVQLGLANLIHGFHWRLPDNQSPETLDMSETFGLSTPKTVPLVAMVKPRLPSHLYDFTYPDRR